MKHLTVCTLALALILSFFSVSGCIKESGTSGLEQTGSKHIADQELTLNRNNDFQASYYYLLARRYDNKNEIHQAQKALEIAIAKDPDSSFLQREYIIGLQNQKKSGQALTLAEDLAENDPNDVENLILLARLKKGDEKEMTSLLERILQLAPENKETFLRLGKVYMDEGMTLKAMNLFSRMVSKFPDYYVAHFYLGESRRMADQPAAAKESYLRTLELEPDLLEPRFRLVDVYKAMGEKKNKSDIIAVLKEILDFDPGNERALIELGLFYFNTKNYQKADDIFVALGREIMENSDLLVNIVQILIPEHRYQDAVTILSQIRKIRPGNANIDFFLGMAYEGLKKPGKAIEYYLKVTPDHPQYKKTILSIAFLYKDMNRIVEAIQFLEQHHRQSPADIDITAYLASFYQENNRYDIAVTMLERALKETPKNTALLFKLGTVMDAAGHRRKSIETMNTIIRIDPKHASALNYLGYTYAEMGIHLDQALELVQRALAIRPEDGYITDSLGWVYYKKQEYDKAVFYLEKAVALSNYETVITIHLADAYLKTGEREKAIAMYKKALNNAGEDQKKEIREIEEKLKKLEHLGQ
ncbi:tetratricopeptide repeat protein [Desulfobacter latus]|uniref:Tetratricopeptide repeat protein n=1 Tax=Desulfobacter latus TaxID=2292 RepID=A0A850T5S8_9BACT|nr:tetratricopeptide repeat protein [Desulfobacter latus]NWH04285.1 tetratricopeptide repeat protein [Desulfobacter latus]